MSNVKSKVNYECSNCGNITEVTPEQIAREITLICRCRQHNKLVDKDGYYRKELDSTNTENQRIRDALNKYR